MVKSGKHFNNLLTACVIALCVAFTALNAVRVNRKCKERLEEPEQVIVHHWEHVTDTLFKTDTVFCVKTVAVHGNEQVVSCPVEETSDSVFVYSEPKVKVEVCSEVRPEWVRCEITAIDTLYVFRDRIVSSDPEVLAEPLKQSPEPIFRNGRFGVSVFAGPGVCVGKETNVGICFGVGLSYRF